MPTNVLSDTKCKTAKAAEKPYKLFDGHGLYLYVTPAGGKLWRLTYRRDGKAQTQSLGPYPLLGLADARAKRDALRLALLNGQSIKTARKAQTITVRDACEEYWNGRVDVSAEYRMNALSALENYVYPKLGKLSLREVDRPMVMEILRAMEASGKLVYLRKLRGWLGQVFDWGMEHEHQYCTDNPCTAINTRKAFAVGKVESFAALELSQVQGFMKRLELEGMIQSAQACRLMALLATRTKELRFTKWTDRDGDLVRISGDRMKKELDLLIPLSRQAKAIWDNMAARSTGSEYVFVNARDHSRPMSENTVLYLIGRMGYGGEMTGHGWRTVFSTWCNENGFNPDAIERQLAHVPTNKVRRVYNRAAYLAERVKIMQAWADWLMPDQESVSPPWHA